MYDHPAGPPPPYHILGCLITGLYYNNVGYVLAQVESLVFCQQMAQEYTHQVHHFGMCTQGVYSGHFVYQILYSPPMPKYNLNYYNRERWWGNPLCVILNVFFQVTYDLVPKGTGIGPEQRKPIQIKNIYMYRVFCIIAHWVDTMIQDIQSPPKWSII